MMFFFLKKQMIEMISDAYRDVIVSILQCFHRCHFNQNFND